MNLQKRVVCRWRQFHIEVVDLVSGIHLLIVNLWFLGKARADRANITCVIVDSWREAIVLRFLCFIRLLPRCKVVIASYPFDLTLAMPSDIYNQSLVIATSKAFIKNYQSLSNMRNRRKLIVL